MAVIDERLRDRIREAPGEAYQVIVRTDGDTEEVAEVCRSRGMVVRRLFNLLPGLSVTAKGEALLELTDNPHVKRIEADREVSAF